MEGAPLDKREGKEAQEEEKASASGLKRPVGPKRRREKKEKKGRGCGKKVRRAKPSSLAPPRGSHSYGSVSSSDNEAGPSTLKLKA